MRQSTFSELQRGGAFSSKQSHQPTAFRSPGFLRLFHVMRARYRCDDVGVMWQSRQVSVEHAIQSIASVPLVRVTGSHKRANLQGAERGNSMKPPLWVAPYALANDRFELSVRCSFAQNTHPIALCMSDQRYRKRIAAKIDWPDKDAVQCF